MVWISGGPTGTWKKDEPDYMTIRVKDELAPDPPLPPRLYRQQNSSRFYSFSDLALMKRLQSF